MRALGWEQAGMRRTGFTQHVRVLKAYMLLAIVSLTVFGILHITVEGIPLLGYVEVSGAVVIALTLAVLQAAGNVTVARNSFLLVMIGTLAVVFVTGGTRGTGIFWFFLFPVAAFFLAGKREGSYWMTALISVICAVWVSSHVAGTDFYYTDTTVRQLLITLLVVAVGIYVYQASLERSAGQTQESWQDLQDYLDHMTTFSTKINPDGRVVFANLAAKSASGLGEKLIGSNFLHGAWWRVDNAQERVEAAFRKVLTGEPVMYDEHFSTATTTPTDLVINLSMTPISKGRRVKYVLFEGRDISGEKAVERAKSEFVTLASHQLRTPITAIAWLSELLLNGDAGALKPEQAKQLQQIYKSNERMAALVDAMLTASSLELDSLPVRPERIDLAKLSHQVVESRSKALLEHKKLHIIEAYDPALPKPNLDQAITKIILQNLVSNALKYTPDKGRVRVAIKVSKKAPRHNDRKGIVIEVSDTGLGIPKLDQPKIFTKLFRADNIKAKDTDGTGLGLYIVKAAAEYVGGHVWFESVENKGSTFSVLLPVDGVPGKKRSST